MIVPSQITSHIQKYLSLFTDLFDVNLSLDSVTVIDSRTIRIASTADNDLEEGKFVIVPSGLIENQITEVEIIGNNLEFTTEFTHDLNNSDLPLDDINLLMDGFTEPIYNSNFNTQDITAGNKFQIESPQLGYEIDEALGVDVYMKAINADGEVSVEIYLGPELAIDGDFSNSINWNEGPGWTIGSGVATCDGTASVTTNIGPSLTIGTLYQTIFATISTTGGTCRMRLGSVLGPTHGGAGEFTDQITANGSNLSFQSGTGFVGSIDNVSVRKITDSMTNVVTLKDSWTKVATDVLSGFITIINSDPQYYLYKTVPTGDSAPTDNEGSLNEPEPKPVVLNGSELLLENRPLGIKGFFEVTNIIDTKTFEISIPDEYPEIPLTGVRSVSVVTALRVAAAATIERAIKQYTKQSSKDDDWMFCIMSDTDTSKDRHTLNDSEQTATSQDEMRQKFLQHFILVVFIPTDQELSGADAQEVAYGEIFISLMNVLFGQSFYDENDSSDYLTVSKGHGPGIYNSAYYTHVYEWQIPVDATFDLGVQGNIFKDVAFRKIEGKLKPFDTDNPDGFEFSIDLYNDL